MPGDAGPLENRVDPVGANGSPVADVVVEIHGPELLADQFPFRADEEVLEVGLDGRPVDVGERESKMVADVPQEVVDMAVVGDDQASEGFEASGRQGSGGPGARGGSCSHTFAPGANGVVKQPSRQIDYRQLGKRERPSTLSA
ncbi:hypothetical protein ACXR2U_00910 [Jatrophihabitans sp. YIM 134969]